MNGKTVYLLAIQMALVLALLALPEKPKYTQDARGYIRFFEGGGRSLTAAETIFAQERTAGYPVILKIASRVSPNYRILPFFHYLLYALSLVVFWKALRTFGVSEWPAFAAVSSMIYAKIAWSYFSLISTDTVGAAFDVLCVAVAIIASSGRGRPRAWIGLAAVFVAAVLVRPSNLTLVVILPLAGFLLRLLRADRAGTAARSAATLLAAALIPCVIYAFMQHRVTGKFALTHAGGSTLMTVASELLTREMAERLPADIRPLAREIVRVRREKNFPDGVAWTPKFEDYMWYYNYFDWVSFSVDRVAYENLYSPSGPPDIVKMNETFGALASTIIRRRFIDYAALSLESLAQAGASILWNNPLVFGLIVMCVGSSVAFGVFAARMRVRRPGWRCSMKYTGDFLAVFTIGVVFCLVNVLSISMIQVPLPRYMHAAAVFLPGVLCAGIVTTWMNAFDSDAGLDESPAEVA